MSRALKIIFSRERLSFQKALGSAAIVGLGLMVARLAALATSVLVARYSDASTFGAFTLFITILLLASEIPGAFDAAYIRFANAPNRNAESSKYLSAAFISKFGYVLAVVFLGVALICLYSRQTAYDDRLSDLILGALVSGGLLSIFATAIARFQQRKQFVPLSAYRPLPNILIFSGVLLLVMTSKEVKIVDIQVVFLSVSSLIVLLTLWLNRVHLVAGFRSIYRDYARVAFVMLLTAIVTMGGGRFDVFLLTTYIGFAELSEYGVGMRVALIVSMATGIIAVILTPKAPEVQAERQRFNRYLGLAAFYALGQTVIAIILIIWIEPVIVLLFGDAYNTSLTRTVSGLLILQMLLTAYGIPFQALIQAGSHPSHMLKLSLIRAVATVFVLLLIVPQNGARGAAATLAGVSAISTGILFWLAMVTCRPKGGT